jgi:pseudouridine synthase
MSEGIRLNKFLASCGVGSRRKCDELIQAGRIEVNGQPCINLGTRVTDEDAVRVDGKRIRQKTAVVVALHKPRGFVCSRNDELGRETIYSLLPVRLRSLHHVGRLDLDSEGLLILTNDGDLTQRLMHPSQSVEKEYLVTADQAFQGEHLDQFLEGIHTPDGKLRAKAIERMSPRRIKVILDHGAKRQIRVMLEAMGYKAMKLLRVRIGALWLGDLAAGAHAVLQASEIAMLLGQEDRPTARREPKKQAKKVAKKTHSPATAPPRSHESATRSPAKSTPPRAPRGTIQAPRPSRGARPRPGK